MSAQWSVTEERGGFWCFFSSAKPQHWCDEAAERGPLFVCISFTLFWLTEGTMSFSFISLYIRYKSFPFRNDTDLSKKTLQNLRQTTQILCLWRARCSPAPCWVCEVSSWWWETPRLVILEIPPIRHSGSMRLISSSNKSDWKLQWTAFPLKSSTKSTVDFLFYPAKLSTSRTQICSINGRVVVFMGFCNII